MTKIKQKTTAAFVQTKENFKMNLNFVFQEFHFQTCFWEPSMHPNYVCQIYYYIYLLFFFKPCGYKFTSSKNTLLFFCFK